MTNTDIYPLFKNNNIYFYLQLKGGVGRKYRLGQLRVYGYKLLSAVSEKGVAHRIATGLGRRSRQAD